MFLGIAIFNTAIGIIQEIRSKRQVDKMVLLAEGKINVLRNGQDMQIRSEDIVLGDIIQLGRGDQIPVDGVTVRSRGIEVDESPITGESETISKNIGDKLTSGTYLIGGSGKMRVTKVGADTFVNHLSSEAKQGEDTSSILLNTINRIIKSLTYVIIPLGISFICCQSLWRNWNQSGNFGLFCRNDRDDSRRIGFADVDDTGSVGHAFGPQADAGAGFAGN